MSKCFKTILISKIVFKTDRNYYGFFANFDHLFCAKDTEIVLITFINQLLINIYEN